MSEQDFRERVLSAIDDLKRTIERMDDRTDKRLTTVEKSVSELRGDVRWIRGKLEGRQEAA